MSDLNNEGFFVLFCRTIREKKNIFISSFLSFELSFTLSAAFKTLSNFFCRVLFSVPLLSLTPGFSALRWLSGVRPLFIIRAGGGGGGLGCSGGFCGGGGGGQGETLCKKPFF
jgi:hypothetical protein